jgi:2-dehydro-3-deoxyphosphogluconate aldolase/(4S)-4-hydroxy-2-oxoglutarate aldolase
MNRIDIFQLAGAQGLIPPFNHTNAEAAKHILTAAYAGGLRIIEFTNRSPNALEVFEELVNYVDKKLPGMVLGAGTIMNEQQANQFFKAGAKFIVSPVLTKTVGDFCNENKVFWCPGAATPTEVIQAHEWGADLVKIFPAEILGPSFVRALRGPCPWVKVMPSGGVTTDANNLKQWFEAGVVCVAVGSQLFTKEIMQDGNYNLLTSRIDSLLTAIQNSREANREIN